MTTRKSWYHIESVLTEIKRLCTEAREQDRKSKQERQAEWLGENEVVTEVMPSPLAASESAAKNADIVKLRADLRQRLKNLEDKLSADLPEREVFYALFPIVVYTDELVRSAVHDRAAQWPALQFELYNIENGGEVFYKKLDELLAKNETEPLIFEIFYFCLKDGFLGQWQDNPMKVQEYMNRAASAIQVAEYERESQSDVGDVRTFSFPYLYYVVAGAGVLLAFLVIQIAVLQIIAEGYVG